MVESLSDVETSTSEWGAALTLNALRRMRYAAAALESQVDSIVSAGELVARSLSNGGKVLVCGNGGSAAAAQHFAAEFTGKLALDRRPMPAISLTVDTSAMTAIANDWSYEEVFARQATAYAGPDDVLVGLSTSGTSRNVRLAMEAAAANGAATIALTGLVNKLGGDVRVEVPLRETARVQEVHDLVLHEIAQIAERLVVPQLDDDSSADRFPFVLPVDGVRTFRDWIERSGQDLISTNGVFDLLHEGHLASLSAARALGDRLVVLVNSDASTRRLKGDSRPVLDLDQRIRDLERTALVDHVVVLDADDPVELLGVVRPHVHTKGDQYKEQGLPEAAVVEAHGGRVEFLPTEGTFSTTATVTRIRG